MTEVKPPSLAPFIDAALLEWLDKKFPERSPRLGDSIEDLMWNGGQRSVVMYLITEAARQAKAGQTAPVETMMLKRHRLSSH